MKILSEVAALQREELQIAEMRLLTKEAALQDLSGAEAAAAEAEARAQRFHVWWRWCDCVLVSAREVTPDPEACEASATN